jgi:RNA recognition motif-containing protein
MLNRILYVGNLDLYIKTSTLYETFGEQGKVKDIQVRTVKSRYSSSRHCIAFVYFQYNCDAVRALKEIKMIDGKKAVIRWSKRQLPLTPCIMSPPPIPRVKIESWL